MEKGLLQMGHINWMRGFRFHAGFPILALMASLMFSLDLGFGLLV